jgi:thiamine monophosphate synthase
MLFFCNRERDQGETDVSVFNRALDGGVETMQLEPKNVRSNAAIEGRDII